jgi:ribosomal 50S subunit-recycling heat shock protein
MEEVRVSSISRVKAWRDAEYRSLNDELNTFAATEQVSRTESIVKDFIDELMVTATDTDRNISILSIATDQTRGTAQTIPVSEKDQRLDRLVEPVLAIDDYGHKISLDLTNTKIKYDIIVGVDRSDEVQFTEDFFNLLEMNRHVSVSNYRNVVYMNGDGVSGEYGSASGLSRREISITDFKLTTADLLSDRADQELQGKYYKTESIQGVIRLEGNPFQYPDDFDLGDLVTVVFKDTKYTVQITEIEETRNGDKRDIQVTFGTPQRTLAKRIADMVN